MDNLDDTNLLRTYVASPLLNGIDAAGLKIKLYYYYVVCSVQPLCLRRHLNVFGILGAKSQHATFSLVLKMSLFAFRPFLSPTPATVAFRAILISRLGMDSISILWGSVISSSSTVQGSSRAWAWTFTSGRRSDATCRSSRAPHSVSARIFWKSRVRESTT